MSLSFKDVDEILALIDRSGFAEVRIEFGDLRLHVSRGAGAPAAAPEPPLATIGAAAPALAADVVLPPGMTVVRAPMLGVFYRAPAPGTPPFVEVGAQVAAEDTVGLIEVMKLFTTLRAGTTGRVAAILVRDGAQVALDQPLLLIEPDAD